MKTIMITMALIAFACAHEKPSKGVGHFDEEKINKIREKWMSMTEEERQEQTKMLREERPGNVEFGRVPHPKHIPEEVRQNMYNKFESMSADERQQLHEGIRNKIRADIAAMPEDVKEKIRKRFEKFGGLTDEERKEEIQKISSNRQDKFESLSPEKLESIREKIHAKIQSEIEKLPEEVQKKLETMREKFSIMTTEERKQEISKIREEHQAKFQLLSPEKRQEIHEKIQKKIHADIAHLPEDVQENIMSKFESKFDKFSAQNEEKFQEVMMLRDEHRGRIPPPPLAFLESLSLEERKELYKNTLGYRFPQRAVPYDSETAFVQAHSHIGKMTEEERQKIRQKFESLTPEQRAEIRRQISVHSRLPTASFDNENFQNIRTVLGDVIVKDDFIRNNNRKHHQ